MKPFLEAINLRKSYASDGAVVEALRGVNIAIEAGERVALLGKSGSGKSTLLNLIGGLDRPTSGTLRVGDRDLLQLDSEERAAYRRETVGMVFQAFHLITGRTALENVEWPLILSGESKRQRREKATAMLKAVGLIERMQHTPEKLSGGERQRVAIARALIHGPKLILADEPTGNLDSTTGTEVMSLMLREIETSGASLILVTHDEELAKRYTTRILRLKDGALDV